MKIRESKDNLEKCQRKWKGNSNRPVISAKFYLNLSEFYAKEFKLYISFVTKAEKNLK